MASTLFLNGRQAKGELVVTGKRGWLEVFLGFNKNARILNRWQTGHKLQFFRDWGKVFAGLIPESFVHVL